MGAMLLGEANREAPVGTEPHPTRSLALPVPGLLRQPAPYLNAYGLKPELSSLSDLA
jgi:hypothetical protein